MHTVTDLSELRPRVVSDESEIDRLRWFQMNRYFESGLLQAPPTCLPNDRAVQDSTYFGVYAGDEIRATARIIEASASGLPMLEHHSLFPDAQRLIEDSQGTVAEISRLAVDSSMPHYRELALLSREFLRFGLRNPQASLLVASVGEPLVRILDRLLGVPLHRIGPMIEQYGDFVEDTVPILIDPIECLEKFRTQQSRRWEFFVDGLVIDLTNDRGISLPECDRLERVAS